MKERSFADFMVGALACISVLGFYAVMRDADAAYLERRRKAAARWVLPCERPRTCAATARGRAAARRAATKRAASAAATGCNRGTKRS
jgi:hypothetical protein